MSVGAKIPNEIYLRMYFLLAAAITGLLFLIGYVLDEKIFSTCLEVAENADDVARYEDGKFGGFSILAISWLIGLGVSFFIAVKKCGD